MVKKKGPKESGKKKKGVSPTSGKKKVGAQSVAARGEKKQTRAKKATTKKKATLTAKKKTTTRKATTPETTRKTTGRKATSRKPSIKKGSTRKTAAAKKKKTTKAASKPAPTPSSITKILDTTGVESTKFEMKPPRMRPEKPAYLPAPPRELPTGYGDTKVVLLVRDPEWVFAYWEINDETRASHNLVRGKHSKTLALRVFDVSDIDFDGTNAHRFYDVIINDYAVSWYLRMPEVNRSWCVDIGYYDEKSGEFMALARSNTVRTPPSYVSEHADEEWMQVSQERFEEILRLSGGLNVLDFSGSENVLQAMSERLKVRIEQAGGASGAIASGQVVKRPPVRKDFWLTVNTDLIVYGATEPDARVTIQGRVVTLRNDGTFSIRFSLPDGTRVIPVRAVNAAGNREREITPKVKKETY